MAWPAIWGPVYWAHIHALSKTTEKEMFVAYLRQLFANLPCPACRMHSLEGLNRYQNNVSSSFRLAVDLHNAVNRKHGKRQYTYAEAERQQRPVSREHFYVFWYTTYVSDEWDAVLSRGLSLLGYEYEKPADSSGARVLLQTLADFDIEEGFKVLFSPEYIAQLQRRDLALPAVRSGFLERMVFVLLFLLLVQQVVCFLLFRNRRQRTSH